MADAEYQREWYKNNKTRVFGYYKKYDDRKRVEDPLYFVKKILREKKRTSLHKNIPFDLTLEDISDVPSHCPILGLELQAGKGINNPNSPSLDRIIPELGYVKGNVHWISWRANRIKSDATVEELKKIMEYLNALPAS